MADTCSLLAAPQLGSAVCCCCSFLSLQLGIGASCACMFALQDSVMRCFTHGATT